MDIIIVKFTMADYTSLFSSFTISVPVVVLSFPQALNVDSVDDNFFPL